MASWIMQCEPIPHQLQIFYFYVWQLNSFHLHGRGYLAPEYTLWGQLSEKADVFSFGVLLLEIVSGRRNIDPGLPEDEVYLPNYVSYDTFSI